MGVRLGRVGGVVLLAFLAVAVLGPVISPYEPGARSGLPFEGPSADHLLGTDDVGHDLFSEVLAGSRISLVVGVTSAALATVIGVSVGVVAGYRRGWIDAFLMRAVDLALVLPVVALVIVLATYLGPGLRGQVLTLSMLLWASSARTVRAQVLSTRARLYVDATRSFGARSAYVMRRHIVPAVVPLAMVALVRAVTAAILLEASLSFLGLGDPLARSWGSIVHFATARGAFFTGAWLWWIVPPGLCIALVATGFAFVGVWFEERADPRLARGTPGAAGPGRWG